MSKPVKKLFDLEIDEVSVVDRAANQHSLIAFAKSANAGEVTTPVEESMPEEIFDQAGNAVDVETLEHGDVVFDADGAEYVWIESDDDEFSELEDDDRVLAGVGKSDEPVRSLGETVLEELSKAVSDADRERVIAKAMDEVSKAQSEAREAREWAMAERDARLTTEYISKAAEYNLPVSPEVLGPILKSIDEKLDEAEAEVIKELLASVGDSLYTEIGYVGESSNSSVLDTVDAYAAELIGKSDLTREQALTAMFEANPEAYDAYLSEGR
jgi:hypothetical protein